MVGGKCMCRDVFYSMWRSRTVPCPRGSGRPACETVLLHHEQFKIPENLARFAVKAGMAGFVKKMGPAVAKFVTDRRITVEPVRSCCSKTPCTDATKRPSSLLVSMMSAGMHSDRCNPHLCVDNH